MQQLICDGCGKRIADDDPTAVRRLTLPGIDPVEIVDWCGYCVMVIRAELPRLAAQAREADRKALLHTSREPVRSRALNIWASDAMRLTRGQVKP